MAWWQHALERTTLEEREKRKRYKGTIRPSLTDFFHIPLPDKKRRGIGENAHERIGPFSPPLQKGEKKKRGEMPASARSPSLFLSPKKKKKKERGNSACRNAIYSPCSKKKERREGESN